MGPSPRLVLACLTTQAVRTRSPGIQLGPNLSDFMYRLGLTPVTGKLGTVARLRDQLHRLFSTTIRWTYTEEDRGGASGRGLVIAGEHQLGWSPRDPSHQTSWRSRLVLGKELFDEITSSAIPVDLRALLLLKRSPLALDIYVWLTYRMSYLRRPCLVPWDALRTQFGADYSRTRDFQARFCSKISQIVGVYPDLRVETAQTGVLLKPSPTHICRARPRAEMGS